MGGRKVQQLFISFDQLLSLLEKCIHYISAGQKLSKKKNCMCLIDMKNAKEN